jgi:hypothetical protein
MRNAEIKLPGKFKQDRVSKPMQAVQFKQRTVLSEKF